jgi:hypothetical protein
VTERRIPPDALRRAKERIGASAYRQGFGPGSQFYWQWNGSHHRASYTAILGILGTLSRVPGMPGPGMRHSAGGCPKPQTKTPMPNRRHLVPRPAHGSPAELGYHRHWHTGERPLEAKLSAIAFGLCLASPVAPRRSENPRPKLDAAKPPSTITTPCNTSVYSTRNRSNRSWLMLASSRRQALPNVFLIFVV